MLTLSPKVKLKSTTYDPSKVLEYWLKKHGISQYRLAKEIDVPPRRINEIILGKRKITPNTALRLAVYFGNSPIYWLDIQSHWDLEQEKANLQSTLSKINRIKE